MSTSTPSSPPETASSPPETPSLPPPAPSSPPETPSLPLPELLYLSQPPTPSSSPPVPSWPAAAPSSSAAGPSSRMGKKRYYWRSSDGETIMEIEEAFVAQSGFLRSFLHNHIHTDTADSDSDSDTNSITETNDNNDLILPIENVDIVTIDLVMEYCRYRYKSYVESDQDTLNVLDSEFIATYAPTRDTLQDLMHAAEALEIESLLNLTRNRIEEYDAERQNEHNLERREQKQTLALCVVSISVIVITMIYCGIYVFDKHTKKN